MQSEIMLLRTELSMAVRRYKSLVVSVFRALLLCKRARTRHYVLSSLHFRSICAAADLPGRIGHVQNVYAYGVFFLSKTPIVRKIKIEKWSESGVIVYVL